MNAFQKYNSHFTNKSDPLLTISHIKISMYILSVSP
jgi:hypothetical protein